MNALVDELVSVLEQQTEGTSQLVTALQEDQQRIIKHDIPGLEASNLRKQQLVLELQGLEQSRREIAASLGRALGLPADEIRVSTLCPALGPDGERLHRAAERLRAVIGSLQELVAAGRGFLEQSILGIRSLLSLIHSLRTGHPQAYDATGRLTPAPQSAASTLRQDV